MKIVLLLSVLSYSTLAMQPGAMQRHTAMSCSGLQSWLDADYGIFLSSTNATNVLDRSFNGRRAYQTTAGKIPGWSANQVNGHAVLAFDGANFWLNWNCNDTDLKDASRTKITILFAVKDNPAGKNTVISTSTSVAGTLTAYAPYSDGNFYFDCGNQSTARLSGSGNATSFSVVQLMRDGTNMFISKNGTQIAVSSAKSGTNSAPAAMFIGAYGGTQDWLNGQLQELQVWNRVLNTNEVADFRKAMEVKIGVTQN